MPTTISNAIGTEQQFTPRADNTYRGNYQGLSAVNVQSSETSRGIELAQNMARLGDALSSYLVSHERYKDEMGHIMAERMINSETPEDIKKLNTIDAAQQYGYADASANPYFRAYAEKIRGGFLAARMKQEYDQKYSMSPAKSLSEEAQRYQKFSSEWKEANVAGDSAPSNVVAFNDGFDESQLVNMNTLSGQWVSTKHKEDVTNVMASVKSRLGSIIANSRELLKTNGALTTAVQSVFNETRLMGVPAENRMQLAEYFANQIVSTGHIDSKRFEQMADNITIQTSIDGSTTKLSDVLDKQLYRTAAAKYNASYLSQSHYETAQKYIKMGKKGLTSWLGAVDSATPEERLWMAPLTSYIKGEIEKNENRQIANMKYQLQHGLGANGGKGKGKPLNDPKDVNTILDNWMNYQEMVNGMPITSYKIDDTALYQQFLPKVQQLMADEDYDGLSRLLSLPQANDLRSTLSSNFSSILSNLRPTDEWEYGTSAGGNASLKQLLMFMNRCPNLIAANFSDSLAADAYTLNSLVSANGEDAGFRLFAVYNTTDKETKEDAAKEFDDDGFVDKSIDGVSRIATNGLKTEDMGLSSDANSLLIPMVRRQFVAYKCTGMNDDDAWMKVKSALAQNFYAYHEGLYPKSLANNMGTGNDDMAFKLGLDNLCYAAAGDTENANDVFISYDPNAKMIRARIRGTNYAAEWSIDRIREEGVSAFQKQMDAAKAAEASASQKEDASDTPEDINNSRNASGSEFYNENSDENRYEKNSNAISEYAWSRGH